MISILLFLFIVTVVPFVLWKLISKPLELKKPDPQRISQLELEVLGYVNARTSRGHPLHSCGWPYCDCPPWDGRDRCPAFGGQRKKIDTFGIGIAQWWWDKYATKEEKELNV